MRDIHDRKTSCKKVAMQLAAGCMGLYLFLWSLFGASSEVGVILSLVGGSFFFWLFVGGFSFAADKKVTTYFFKVLLVFFLAALLCLVCYFGFCVYAILTLGDDLGI